jgi:hypothetical protein
MFEANDPDAQYSFLLDGDGNVTGGRGNKLSHSREGDF